MSTRTGYDKPRRGQYFGKWALVRRLDSGGNGEVWEATDGGIASHAIKILLVRQSHIGKYRLERFREEVKFLTNNPDIDGILPLVDSNLSTNEKQPPWYVMPMAQPLKDALGEDPEPETVVKAVASIARTLATLAERGIGHRDIKPANLFRLDSRWVIGDFGLVTYPEKNPQTQHGIKLGPTDFMAPEMRADADSAQAEPADVWALSKTLWSLLAKTLPLPGTHRPTDPAFTLRDRINYCRAPELDLLLERASAMNPRQRPPMKEIAEELTACLEEPAEAVPDASISELERRVKALIVGAQQAEAAARERRESVNSAFNTLAQIQRNAFQDLVQRTSFSGFPDQNITDAILLLPRPRSGIFYAHYNTGAKLAPPGQHPQATITVAVGLRVVDEQDPAEIAALLRVEHWYDHQSNVKDIWKKTYKVQVGSAQHTNAVAEISAGFTNGYADTLRTVAAILAIPEDRVPDWFPVD